MPDVPSGESLLSEAAHATAIRGWRWIIATGRVEWSRGLEELYGMGPETFGGSFDAYLALLPDGDRQHVQEAIKRALDFGDAYDIEHRVFVANGEYRWVASRAEVIRDAEGKPVSMVGVVWDVTRRRTAEARLRESEERVRFHAALLAQVNEAVIAADGESRINYWNAAAERLYGYTAEEAIGQDGTALLKTSWPNPNDGQALVESLLANGVWRGEMVQVKKSGESIVVEASIRLLMDASGVPFCGITVMQDVTAKRQLEEQLRQSQKMEAIGVLAGGVAHDFNNLLGVILGFSELTLQHLPADHADASSLGEIISASKRGADLTRKLLAFSRRQIMRMASVDLNAAIAGVTKLIARILGEDIDLVVKTSPTSLVIRADVGQIEQLLFNLCTNARQAMPRGGKLLLSTRLAVIDEAFAAQYPWARAGRFAELQVSDTGVGIEPATLERIFEPFFTTKEQGTGLGLSTVYGIATRHGGVVHAESTPGSGATFRMHFPIIDQPILREPVKDAEPVAPGGTETILIAEDAAPLRSLMTTTLTRLGYRVIAVGDGVEAVRAYAEQAGEIALVVLDVVMPRMGALEAYERMRALRADVRVVFTTGYAPDAGKLERLLDGGRLRLLEKPFSPGALGLCVREAIDV